MRFPDITDLGPSTVSPLLLDSSELWRFLERRFLSFFDFLLFRRFLSCFRECEDLPLFLRLLEGLRLRLELELEDV